MVRLELHGSMGAMHRHLHFAVTHVGACSSAIKQKRCLLCPDPEYIGFGLHVELLLGLSSDFTNSQVFALIGVCPQSQLGK